VHRLIDEFSASLGGRLRAARRQRGWSLGEVEGFTEGEFKASVVGAYERGERAISVQRFARLAEIYQVEPAELLPATGGRSGVVIDLDLVAGDSGDDLVDRYLAAIQLLRRDASPHEVRVSDKALIASLLESSSRPAAKA
jgi:transcriptional regulator with XRE-family HTH domain